MKRYNIYFNEEDYNYLKGKPGRFSEHARTAVSQYVHRMRQEDVRLERFAGVSESTRRDGE